LETLLLLLLLLTLLQLIALVIDVCAMPSFQRDKTGGTMKTRLCHTQFRSDWSPPLLSLVCTHTAYTSLEHHLRHALQEVMMLRCSLLSLSSCFGCAVLGLEDQE
jgi:hypothetical protein